MASLRSHARFLWRYGNYIAARVCPSGLFPPSWTLPRRFRYQLFWVSPDEIRWKPGLEGKDLPSRVVEESLLQRMDASFAVRGEWDTMARSFELHPAVRELIVEEVAIRDSQVFRTMSAAVQSGDQLVARGCVTRQEVEDRLVGLRRMYDSIEAGGYRTQIQLRRPPVDEIMICIGRKSRLMLLRHGNHRLSMAKVLGLPRVPVIVRGVHVGWVRDWMDRIGTENPVRAVERGLHDVVERGGDSERTCVDRRWESGSVFHE